MAVMLAGCAGPRAYGPDMRAIRDGRGKMPAFKGKLMGRDFTVIVQHVRSLAPAKR